MKALVTPDDPILVGVHVYYRKHAYSDLRGVKPLATFSSYHIGVVALKLLRKGGDWMRGAELMLDDEDFLTVQVLARRLSKKVVAREKVRMDSQLFPESQNGTGQRMAVSPTLEDLI